MPPHTQRRQQSGLTRGHTAQSIAVMNQPPSYPSDNADLGFHSLTVVHSPPLVNTHSQRILPMTQRSFKHADVKLLSLNVLPEASPSNT